MLQKLVMVKAINVKDKIVIKNFQIVGHIGKLIDYINIRSVKS